MGHERRYWRQERDERVRIIGEIQLGTNEPNGAEAPGLGGGESVFLGISLSILQFRAESPSLLCI